MDSKFQDCEMYPIERDTFSNIFKDIDIFIGNYLNYEDSTVKLWINNDEVYIMHKPSLTVVSYYKLGHVGRCNTCNKTLSIDEYIEFAGIIKKYIVENTGYSFTD